MLRIFDAFPVPRPDDATEKLDKAKFISNLDMIKGYWQIPLTLQAKKKAAFITPFGLFQFKVRPFGMQNGPAIFMCLVQPCSKA